MDSPKDLFNKEFLIQFKTEEINYQSLLQLSREDLNRS